MEWWSNGVVGMSGYTGWNFFQNLGSGCPGWGLGYTGWNFFQNLGSGCPGWGLGYTGWNFFQNLGSGCPGWGLGYTGWNFFQNLGSGWCQGGIERFSTLCPPEWPAFIARKPGKIVGQFDLGLWPSIGGPGFFRRHGNAQDAECFHLPAGGRRRTP